MGVSECYTYMYNVRERAEKGRVCWFGSLNVSTFCFSCTQDMFFFATLLLLYATTNSPLPSSWSCGRAVTEYGEYVWIGSQETDHVACADFGIG